LLWSQIVLRLASAFPWEAAEDEPVKPSAASGVLEKSIGLFELTGGAKPTLEEVNGGRLCVNGFGKRPPGYYIIASISLAQCAAIAAEQPAPLGFRWGRQGFDYAVYTAYATSKEKGGNGSDPVDLRRLFPDPGEFVCTIYTALDSTGQPYTFEKGNVSKHFKPELKDGPASNVCFQRWTMTEFFKPVVSELWFCYMVTTNADHCDTSRKNFYIQGKIFMCVFIFFLGVLGWIMADMAEFERPLVWFTRFLLNMEMAMVTVACLLASGWKGTESMLFYLVAYGGGVVGPFILFIPYYVMEHIREDFFGNTAYLLLLAFSPCFLMEFMSYWSHFILLVEHKPLLVGMIAFASSAGTMRFIHIAQEAGDNHEAEVEIARQKEEEIELDRGSYASVPTDDPGQTSLGTMQSKFLISCGQVQNKMDDVLDKIPHPYV